MKILAIVPSFNEEENIAGVIESITKENSLIDILVVNDGSNDRTGAVARSSGLARVVNLPCNLGIGGAVQTGFIFAQREGYDIAFQFDGDGQHIASEIEKILAPVRNEEADVVIGSRFCGDGGGYRSSPSRRLGIKVFEIVNSLLIKQKITDNTSGFRAYNRRAIRFLARNYPMDYPEPEAILILGKNGFRLREVPVLMRKRGGGHSSISGSGSLYYMVKVLLALLVCCIRPREIKD
ncbi:MAG TPA: glycosyltransferase family 2 protein [Syntrophales bacterium]|nr:glycosyltransferase family 2 protein [Syntrophales bacterium]HPQ43705.1 glycosyltransferase family 2 protein [Syntrophales bacterium]